MALDAILGCCCCPFYDFREAKVDNFYLLAWISRVENQNIGRLQVTVQDTASVGGHQAGRDLSGDANRSKAEHALENARGQVQSAIADAMRTRTTPRVHFHYDEAVEKAARVNDILSQLARERAEREGPDEDEDADAGEADES